MEKQIDMYDVKDVQAQAVQDKGLIAFEKYIGRINWLHPEEDPDEVRNKRYRVLNKDGEIVFEAHKISQIAKEICVSVSHVSNCMNSLKYIKGEYLVERCGDE